MGGVDLAASLAEITRHHQISAGTVELLGGLTQITFSAYDFVRQQRHPAQTMSGALEIVAGHGTISLLEDQPHVHLHLVVAVRDETASHGMTLAGGHVATANAFAVEFTLTAYDGVPVTRAIDLPTGLQLWSLPSFPVP